MFHASSFMVFFVSEQEVNDPQEFNTSRSEKGEEHVECEVEVKRKQQSGMRVYGPTCGKSVVYVQTLTN